MRLFSRHLSRLSRRAQLESSGGVTQFAEVLRLVKQTPDVVDLGQGFPDFEGNQVARDVAHFAVGSDVRLNQYTPPSGLPALHEAIASFNGRRWREELEPGVNTLVTAGGTEAIFSALIALCNPGDTVAFCQPFWPWYLPSIRLTGAVPAPLTLAPPDFKLDVDALRQLVRERKPKVLITNTPHNPTGAVLSEADLRAIAEICVEHDVLAISDDVYDNVVFKASGRYHLRLADMPGMAERTLTVGSASKLFSLTGWRVGWLTGPADLIRGCAIVHQHATVCAPTPLQAGVAAALDAEDGSYDGVPVLYESNYQALAEAFTDVGLRPCAAQGGYFLVLDAAASGLDDVAFSKDLIEKAGVAGMPMGGFYAEDQTEEEVAARRSLVRFAVCKSRAAVETAASRVRERYKLS